MLRHLLRTSLIFTTPPLSARQVCVAAAALRAPSTAALPSRQPSSYLLAAATWQSRSFASLSDYSKELEEINSKFAEARDEIEMATEDAETVYFNESAEVAKAVTAECLQQWKQLLDKVTPETKVLLQRSMGLKMEQLKQELELLDHLHDDH